MKPQLALFLPPVSLCGFLLGESTQKPEAWGPVPSIRFNLWGTRQDGEVDLERQTGDTPAVCCYLGIPPMKGVSTPTPKTSRNILTTPVLREEFWGMHLSISASPEMP